ncbi:ELAC1 isoform 2 [Pan troglodytes]|uniref:ElaC homolog 1 (E. coli), isoform CRA_a n=2 Tax=Homininae TaxID=207598 RepID=K7EPH7_HUMAN|nr:elaC homolog 1 (E. coli), isoform CRA_a [Homo sapiens]KAI2586907.1 elaC ribonuclease Z 1 [Homo sapiens]KAI4046340.1 elaC ribonuclease Z 1 [Homo sapiens]PNI70031.1 ELAC1 isoform 2 [Pan troglodytes]
MSMDVTFLGTGAAYPSPTRGASAVVLRCEGECWLFDCGEGTQTQLMKSQLKAEFPHLGFQSWKRNAQVNSMHRNLKTLVFHQVLPMGS